MLLAPLIQLTGGIQMTLQIEDNVTYKVAEILRNERTHGWTVDPQVTPFADSDLRPDIMAKRAGYETVAIEAKHTKSGVRDGIIRMEHAYLGGELDVSPENNWMGASETLQTGIVILYPDIVMNTKSEELEDVLRETRDIEYCVITADRTGDFPKTGMVRGSLADIATAMTVGAVPAKKIQEAADKMEGGLRKAVDYIEQSIVQIPYIGTRLSEIIGEEARTEACCKASLFIIDAFIFQSDLSGKEGFEKVRPLNHYANPNVRMDYRGIINDWVRILKINYVPIFKDAVAIVQLLHDYDEKMARNVLRKLWDTAHLIVTSHRHQIHELAGEVFQKLVVDRPYVKANYTLPESAMLLSALVCPDIDVDNLPKVADYACGTGSLLNGVYKEVQRQYEQKTGRSSAEIHRQMLEENLAGTDIYTHCTHLTFTVLASAHPEVTLGATRVIPSPYGDCGEGGYKTGSLELLDEQMLLPRLNAETVRVRGDDVIANVDMRREYPDGEMDIVVINPPFTKPSANNGTKGAYSTFQSKFHSKEVQKALQAELKKKETRVYNGKAGFATAFVDMADRKLKTCGRMGFIVPLGILTTATWSKVRTMLAEEYHDVIVVTIAGDSSEESSFSADTNMGECMVVATKGVGENTGRARFVCLSARPDNLLLSRTVGLQIRALDAVRKLEGAPHGGNTMNIGKSSVARVLDAPISVGEWSVSRVDAISLLQSAHNLSEGRLHLPQSEKVSEIPMATINDVGVVGYTSPKINHPSYGAFEMHERTSATQDGWDALWQVQCEVQRAMGTQPDFKAQVRPNRQTSASQILGRASRTHFHMNLRFTSNSMIASWTDNPSIGVRSMTDVKLLEPTHEIAWTLWMNSTLGLMCHWLNSSKQQAGRGTYVDSQIPHVPTLDVRQLSKAQLDAADRIFAELKDVRMLPYNECVWDDWRHVLDARLLAEVLGITDEETHRGMQNLRETLCAEPTIAGTKQKVCDLEKERDDFNLGGCPDAELRHLAAQRAQLEAQGIWMP